MTETNIPAGINILISDNPPTFMVSEFLYFRDIAECRKHNRSVVVREYPEPEPIPLPAPMDTILWELGRAIRGLAGTPVAPMGAATVSVTVEPVGRRKPARLPSATLRRV
jgi:hypothetical protein